MTAFLRKICLTLLGLLAALAGWSSLELLLQYIPSWGGFLALAVAEGLLVGGFFGLFFGTAEGILLSDKKRALKGALSGLLMGTIGGALAVSAAQGLLTLIESSALFSQGFTSSVILPLSRALGWIILGVIIGSIDGLRTGSLRRMGIGITGGIIGGLAGGLTLEFLISRWDNGTLARGAGLLIMGLCIGLFYSLFEYSRAFGLLKVLTGPLKGKEYVLSMKRTRVGLSKKTSIVLKGYENVSDLHAEILASREGITLKALQGSLLVNEKPVKETELKYEDVIQVGEARLFYLPR